MLSVTGVLSFGLRTFGAARMFLKFLQRHSSSQLFQLRRQLGSRQVPEDLPFLWRNRNQHPVIHLRNLQRQIIRRQILFHCFFSMHAPQSRMNHRHPIPRHQRQAERKHGGSRIAQRAEIAVGDPKVSQTDGQQNLIQQRTFLSMAVFAGKDGDGQTQVRIEHCQRLTGQRSGGFPASFQNPVFGRGKVVSIKNSDVVSRQQRCSSLFTESEIRLSAICTMSSG